MLTPFPARRFPHSQRMYQVFGGGPKGISLQDAVSGLCIFLKGTVEEKKRRTFVAPRTARVSAVFTFSTSRHSLSHPDSSLLSAPHSRLFPLTTVVQLCSKCTTLTVLGTSPVHSCLRRCCQRRTETLSSRHFQRCVCSSVSCRVVSSSLFCPPTRMPHRHSHWHADHCFRCALLSLSVSVVRLAPSSLRAAHGDGL